MGPEKSCKSVLYCWIRLWRLRLQRQFTYNVTFWSIPQASFTCISIRL